MTTCLVSEIECLGYSEHNGIGFLLASTVEHKTVEPEEQRERREGGGRREGGEGERGVRERGQKGSDEEDVITGIPSATHCKQFLQRPHNSAYACQVVFYM